MFFFIVLAPDRRDRQLLVSPPKDTGNEGGGGGGKRNCQSSEAIKLPQRDLNPGPPGRQSNALTNSAILSVRQNPSQVTMKIVLAAMTVWAFFWGLTLNICQ